jgi:hypothetical protein
LFLVATAKSASAQIFDLPQYYEQNNNKVFHGKDEFLQKFPYDAYLQTVSFTDFNTLQRDRYFLWEKFGDGDGFLYNLAERFLRNNPVTNGVNDLNQKINIGESYLNPNKGLKRPVNEIYIIIGYFILSKVAAKISQEIAANKYDESETSRANIIQRLVRDRVYVSREESNSNKLFTNLLKGNFKYVWLRARSIIHTHRKQAWSLTIALIVISIIFILAGHSPRLKLSRASGVLGLLLSLVPLGILTYDSSDPTAVQSPTSPASAQTNLKLTRYLNLYPVNNGSNHAVTVYKLFYSNKEIGQAIWLDRDLMQASYLAFENVPARYNLYRTNNHVALATTGGYTNTTHQPEGFTTEDGNIVNPVIMPDRHGLAMISQGGVNVLNLKKDRLQLPGGPIITNPLNSLYAYAQLLEWCKNKHATLFQTHLLAYSDTLLIDLQKAKPDIRERRILAFARDKKSQKLYHIIFNVTSQYNLAQIAAEIFGLLQTLNLKVEAILNLDVGAYNILNVYDDRGNLLPDLKGSVDINQATNLLIYTN